MVVNSVLCALTNFSQLQKESTTCILCHINAITVKSHLLLLVVEDITKGILVGSYLKMEKSRAESSKITLPTEKQNKFPNGIEFGEAFRFKTPSSILVVGPSGCGKTCFTESLLLDHLEELFLSPPSTIHYYYGVWQDGFQDMKDAGVQFHEGIPETNHLKSWFPKGGLLVLDDLMAEGGEDKELLDLFTKNSHHQNITAKSISRNAQYIVAFKNPRDQLGMRNLLFQAFPTCWQDMMDVYQKVTKRLFGYMVLDLHPGSDDRKRVFSHLLMHEGYPRWHRRMRDVLTLKKMVY